MKNKLKDSENFQIELAVKVTAKESAQLEITDKFFFEYVILNA